MNGMSLKQQQLNAQRNSNISTETIGKKRKMNTSGLFSLAKNEIVINHDEEANLDSQTNSTGTSLSPNSQIKTINNTLYQPSSVSSSSSSSTLNNNNQQQQQPGMIPSPSSFGSNELTTQYQKASFFSYTNDSPPPFPLQQQQQLPSPYADNLNVNGKKK
jgi:hypothetical protein